MITCHHWRVRAVPRNKKIETHQRWKTGQDKEGKESDCRSGTFLEQLSQAGHNERTEGVKSIYGAFGCSHGTNEKNVCFTGNIIAKQSDVVFVFSQEHNHLGESLLCQRCQVFFHRFRWSDETQSVLLDRTQNRKRSRFDDS